MPKQTLRESAFTERQIRHRALAQEIAQRLRPASTQEVGRNTGQYITVSRETGAGGGEIAQMVGERLGWEVLDKNLLDQMAAKYHLSRSGLEIVDETGANWARDIFYVWLDPKIIPHEKYVVYLDRLLRAAARRGRVVIVGRGATFLLPRDQGLAVRLIASEKYRVGYVMRKRGVSEREARRYIEQIDRERQDFLRRFSRHDVNDPHFFDLTITVDRLGPEGAADEIVATWRRWNPATLVVPPPHVVGPAG